MAQLQANTRIYGPASIDGRLLVANVFAISATSNTTGSLIVAGGVGVTGNVFADAIYDSGVELLTYFQGVDNTQNTNITAVNNYSQSAYNTANGANGLAAAAYGHANNAFNSSNAVNQYAQSAYNQANTATGLAQAAFNYANTLTVSSTDQFARDTANSASANTIITQGVDSWQNTQITYVNQFAQAAFNQANTGGGGGTIYNQSLNTTDPVIFSSVTFANNNSSMSGANTAPLTATPNQIVDTFSTTQYRTVKYIIQAVDESAVHSTEVLLTHNDIDVFITEYATLQSASNLMSISANVSSSNVNLIISPTNSNTIIDYHRTTLQIARSLGFSIFGDLMLQTGNEDLMIGSGSWDENT